MSDRYQRIRDALAMGPTPGPWSVRYDYVVQAKSFDEGRLVPIAQPYGLRGDGSDLFANAAHIAACDPDTIRELLAERDALQAERDALNAENERLTRYYKNGIDCFASPCERHSGERTPPFTEFFERYGGQCLICVVDNNKALKAERDSAFALLRECQLILREECGARIDYVELNAFLKGNASAMDILAACGQEGVE